MTTRRAFIRYLGLSGLAAWARAAPAGANESAVAPALGFKAPAPTQTRTHHLPVGYHADVLVRWGDALDKRTAAWRPGTADADAQRRRFGYNNDFISFMPLPFGSGNSAHGLLCVNHEYTEPLLMWPGLTPRNLARDMTAARTEVEIAATGHSILEVRLAQGTWQVVRGKLNRRLCADSDIAISGPAAGHARLRTGADPSATRQAGILNPCSGGKTPWGTVLIAEENFNIAFSGRCLDARERRNHARYGVDGRNSYSWWGAHFPRYRLDLEPNEPNRYGWIIELDPYRPDSVPRKRTALGRFKHEAASCALAPDGRAVVYSGDDSAFEYLYRFVSRGRYDPGDRASAGALLDQGDLSVARFHDDGRLAWIPLLHGAGPLTAENDFHDQGDVLIETRRAADLVGATRLDRPEDVEVNPVDGLVYAMLTNNSARPSGQTDSANPRGPNRFGHVLQLIPPGAPGNKADHAADEFRWQPFLLAGDPANTDHRAHYPGAVEPGNWLAAPDNCAFDPAGRLWIASDQGTLARHTGIADGLWACGTDPDGAPTVKRFFSAPVGAEVCGPEFTPDGRTLFLAVQHPGAATVLPSSYDAPVTRWPDFDPALPPRPAVLAIRRSDGGPIGS